MVAIRKLGPEPDLVQTMAAWQDDTEGAESLGASKGSITYQSPHSTSLEPCTTPSICGVPRDLMDAMRRLGPKWITRARDLVEFAR